MYDAIGSLIPITRKTIDISGFLYIRAIIGDAIKNTNVRIVHKLVAADDASIISECIGLTQEQQRVIPKLSIGQAVLAGFNSANVMSNDSSDIYLAQINKMK